MRQEDKKLNAAIKKAISGFRPPERLTVSEWADRYRRLSPESSAETGQWSTDRTPYLREPMNAFTDPLVRHIVVVAASQVGKSEMMNNMLAYMIDQDPGSALFIQPTTVDCKEYSKLRIAPMIRDCPKLRGRVADPKSRDSANTIMQKSYLGGVLTLCGSREAHSLASKPIRYVFADERDRWAVSAGEEGDPWLLAMARQRTFYNAKSVEVSTPTIKGRSVIAKAYETGTQERWCSKCPHCGEYHEIGFDDVKFDFDEKNDDGRVVFDIKNVWYVCPACGAVSTEREIKSAPARWIAANPEAYETAKTRSFWLTGWCSPWGTWADAIRDFLEARKDPMKLRVVFNTRFGQLWEDRAADISDAEMIQRREDYGAQLADGVLALTCGVDVQDDRLEYEVVGHGYYGETWGVEKGFIFGRPNEEKVWQRLEAVTDETYLFSDGQGMRIAGTCIDTGGHYTQEVYSVCRRNAARRWFAIKGRGGESVPFINPPSKVAIRNTKKQTVALYTIGVDAGKAAIYSSLKVQTPGAKYCHFPVEPSAGYDENYFNGLLSEELRAVQTSKGVVWQWRKIPGHDRNEALDCRNYALAAFRISRPDLAANAQRLRELRDAKQGTETDGAEKASVRPPERPPERRRKVRKTELW